MKIKDTIKKIGLSVILALTMAFSADVAQAWENVGYDTNNGALNYPNITNDFASAISSKSAGSEGIRRIGALGGYTLEEFLEDTSTRGPARDLPSFVYTRTNLNISYSDGDIYDPVNGYFHLVPGSKTLTDNAVNIAYWSTNNPLLIQWTTGTRPDPINNVYLATFITSLGQIIRADTAIGAGDELLYEDTAFANIFPSLIINGLNAFPTGTDLTNIIINSGVEYHNMADRIQHDTFNFNTSNKLVMYGHTASVWTNTTTNLFPVGIWDNNTNFIACDATKWYRGVFVSLDSDLGQLTWIAPDYEYTNDLEAIAGSDPDLPTAFAPYIPKCTAYIFKGDDTTLRDDTTYWVDRRNADNLLKSTTSGGGGGSSGNTPTLQQVLLAGNGTGGILPTGMGLPTTADQAASKEYVDTTINNINSKKVYVDNKGDDVTAKIESSILPFETIQAAINVASILANITNRYLIVLSPGKYVENITMTNYISMRGDDTESTIIDGTVSFTPTFTDATGSEIALITIRANNENPLDINAGADQAYVGIRSCYLIANYDNDATNKTVVHAHRGLVELYATTYCQLTVAPTNGGESVRNAQIFEHTTTAGNEGLSQFTSFASSSQIDCYDTNDNVNMLLTHDNSDAQCINTFIGGLFNVYLNLTNTTYANNIRLVAHDTAIGRTLSMANVLRIYMNETNNCNLFMCWAKNGSGDNVAISRNNHIRIVSGSSSNIWLGAATTTNDSVRIYDTESIQANAFDYYPRRYTNEGSAGKFYVNTPHQNGDHILGGALDMSLMNSSTPSAPESGHVRMYAYTYAGLENPYFLDSSSNSVRLARDHFFNGYNAETNALVDGEAVYVTAGLSPANTPVIKRANASDSSKMPCAGIVVQVGGIGTNRIGRIMRGGRTETFLDTSAFASGDKLYVSATKDGGLTNVAPSAPNISQQVGWCHISSTNGYMNVYLWTPDSRSQLTEEWASGDSNTVNALTLQGYTPEQLSAQQLTYFVYGSQSGDITNHPSKMARLESPVALGVWTSTVTGITNGQIVGNLSIKYDQQPRILTKGLVNLHLMMTRTGGVGNGRTLRGIVTVFESNQVTIAQQFVLGELVNIPVGHGHYDAFVSITNDINITDDHRYIEASVQFVSGWDGAETIQVLSQDGELTRITLPGSAGGVYALANDLDTEIANRISGDTNLQTQIITETNRAQVAEGLLSGRIVTETNRAQVAESGLQTQINTETNRATIAETNLQAQIISATNRTQQVNTNLQAQIITETNRAYVAEGLLSGRIVTETNRAFVAETNLQAQINNATNSLTNEVNARISGDTNLQTQIIAATNLTISLYPTVKRFKANIGNANITYNSTLNLIPFTNIVLAASGGSIYSNGATVSQWWPKATNGVVKLYGSWQAASANSATYVISVYKNGSFLADVYNWNIVINIGNNNLGSTWSFVDTATPTLGDYYQIYTIFNANRNSVKAGTNNWWYGEVSQ